MQYQVRVDQKQQDSEQIFRTKNSFCQHQNPTEHQSALLSRNIQKAFVEWEWSGSWSFINSGLVNPL